MYTRIKIGHDTQLRSYANALHIKHLKNVNLFESH